jgi:hypothetical protein
VAAGAAGVVTSSMGESECCGRGGGVEKGWLWGVDGAEDTAAAVVSEEDNRPKAVNIEDIMSAIRLISPWMALMAREVSAAVLSWRSRRRRSERTSRGRAAWRCSSSRSSSVVVAVAPSTRAVPDAAAARTARSREVERDRTSGGMSRRGKSTRTLGRWWRRNAEGEGGWIFGRG